MQNYWEKKRRYKDEGWIYLNHDFRIKHNDYRVPTIWTDGADEIYPHNIVQEDVQVKCPMCGRIKAVQKREEHLYYCTYCNMLFDDRED